MGDHVCIHKIYLQPWLNEGRREFWCRLNYYIMIFVEKIYVE